MTARAARPKTFAIASAVVITVLGIAFLLGEDPSTEASEPAGSASGSTDDSATAQTDDRTTAVNEPNVEDPPRNEPSGPEQDPDETGDPDAGAGKDTKPHTGPEAPEFGSVSMWVRGDDCDSITLEVADSVEEVTPGDQSVCIANVASNSRIMTRATPYGVDIPAGTVIEGALTLKTSTTDPTRAGEVIMEIYQGTEWDSNSTRIGFHIIGVPAGTSESIRYDTSMTLEEALPADEPSFILVRGHKYIAAITFTFDLEYNPAHFYWQAP